MAKGKEIHGYAIRNGLDSDMLVGSALVDIHSGLVNEGMELFYKMKDVYGVERSPDHYACVVDLLGRSGRLEEAYELIKTMEPGSRKAGPVAFGTRQMM
ncbi:hypothetical protein HPP92_000837 [Vanilla planifolia]|uniref:Pentatricopeptide repeat-containing protein n=1 Tax=Vanilla planifolia TaxID=51239 RepID=A0A835RPY9_VANPL|nr:hypothetical protein HPP92_000837 [Vanilla planifolia]